MDKSNPELGRHMQEDAAETLALQGEFAHFLNEQLDDINYPASPKRATQLSETFGVSKTQAYKLLKGMAAPSLSNLLSLRKMGVSINQMLDLLARDDLELVDLHIQGHVISTSLQFTREDGSTQMMAVPREDQKGVDLCVVPPGKKPTGAKPISGMSFPKRTTLAIIEDNHVELEMLGKSTATKFRVEMFPDASAFFRHPIEKFDVILLDWNLPDASGAEVVRKIRAQSKAAIFILTGDDGAADGIVKVMSDKTIHHVAKPTNIKILIKRLSDAAGPRFRL